eukprot:2541451-Rhodomonas_salina.1
MRVPLRLAPSASYAFKFDLQCCFRRAFSAEDWLARRVAGSSLLDLASCLCVRERVCRGPV